MEQRWIARWAVSDGSPQAYIFSSTKSRGVARIDFMLKLMDMGKRLPNEYELEEAKVDAPLFLRHNTRRP